MNMKFTIKTIGCKVNTYESNKIRDELINIGLEYVDVNDKEEYKDLDFYIVNTCSVTAIADKKSRQMLHLAKKHNRNVKTIAIGCLVDSSPPSGVDYCLSNKEKPNLVSLITSLVGESKVLSKKSVAISPRAFIKIEDGCDEYCTYCLIPYLRGHIKSRDDNDIIEEISEKLKLGVKEVVLTGIHLSSFGLDRKNMHYESEGAIAVARDALTNIIRRIADIYVDVEGERKELMRIRLGSLEPRIIDENFLKFFTNTNSEDSNKSVAEKFCHNLCLSLQSGSDKTLKRMNRHYTCEDFKKACNLIRKYMPDATITTDVIVGFPGETEDDFKESLDFVKSIRFYNPNIFPYSKRDGTKAAGFPDQLTQKEKHDRAIKMIEECNIITKEIEEKYIVARDSTLNLQTVGASSASPIKVGDMLDDILVEEIIEENGNRFALGYTKNYIKRKVQIVGGAPERSDKVPLGCTASPHERNHI